MQCVVKPRCSEAQRPSGPCCWRQAGPQKGRKQGLECPQEGRQQLEGHMQGVAVAGSSALGASKPGQEGLEGEWLWGR